MMKKLYPIALIFGLLLPTFLQAQLNTSTSTQGLTAKTPVLQAAAKAAAESPDIKTIRNSQTGEIQYARIVPAPESGEETLVLVEYCIRSDAFVNARPSSERSCNRSTTAVSAKPAVLRVYQTTQVKSPSDAARKAACSSAGSKVRLVNQN